MTDDDEPEHYVTDPNDDKRRTRKPELLGDVFERVLAFDGITDEVIAARNAERQAQLAREAELARRSRAAVLTSERGFPVRAIEAAIQPRDTLAMARMREFQTDDRTVQVLAGGVGAGKTTAAAWAALEYGRSAPYFVRASELEARGRYDKDLRPILRGCSMLVIDDLGVELLDDHKVFRSLLDEVIDTLYGNRRRIVITTNLRARRSGNDPQEQPQFIERYGERINSRLHEIGRWADCGVVDLRRVAKPENANAPGDGSRRVQDLNPRLTAKDATA